jgi:uncharacterized protein
MEVEMKIRGLMMDPVTNMPIVILKDISGNAVLPIWVGIYEANAIALEIEKVATPRPMTHDLIKSLLLGLNTGVRKVVVNELKEDTFYASDLAGAGRRTHQRGFRPSDALALALRLDCPIFVDDTVLKSSKAAASVSDKENEKELRRWLENLNDEDHGPLQDVIVHLGSRGIQLLSETRAYAIFSRDNLVVAGGTHAGGLRQHRQHRRVDGTRSGVSCVAGRASISGGKRLRAFQATEDEVAAVRRFGEDLKSASPAIQSQARPASP